SSLTALGACHKFTGDRVETYEVPMQPRNLATWFFLAAINLLGGTAAKVLALNNRSSIPPSQLSQATHLRGRINT
ncbi:MAG TPA: hypothetical protein VMZ02_03370, partial [Candidatus Limnocylindrales bacterium]|nr:hypothetical protein [Candidatus Limnocylindrales bacterium]